MDHDESPYSYAPIWDANVRARAAELEGQMDDAYRALTNIILAGLKENVERHGRVLDVGCGLGYLSADISRLGYAVQGIDPSEGSIEYARQHYSQASFETLSVEDFVDKQEVRGSFDAVVANMVMHSVPNIATFARAVRKSLQTPGYYIYNTSPGLLSDGQGGRQRRIA